MGSTYAAIGPRPPAVLRASRPLARSSSLSKPFTISGVQGEEYPSQRLRAEYFGAIELLLLPVDLCADLEGVGCEVRRPRQANPTTATN